MPEHEDRPAQSHVPDLETFLQELYGQQTSETRPRLGLYDEDPMALISPMSAVTTPSLPTSLYALGFGTEIGLTWQYQKLVGGRVQAVEVRRGTTSLMTDAVSLGEFQGNFMVDDNNRVKFAALTTRYYQVRAIGRAGETIYFSDWTTAVSGVTLAAGSTNATLQERMDTFAAAVQGRAITPGAVAASVDLSALSQAVSVLSQQVSSLSQRLSGLSIVDHLNVLSELSVIGNVNINGDLSVPGAAYIQDLLVSATLVVLGTLSAPIIDTLSNAISILSQQVSVLSQDVSARLVSVNNAISVVSQAVSVVSQALSSQAAALSVRIDTQSQAVSVLSQQVSIISQAVSALSQAISVLSQGLSVVSNATSNALSVANAASNAASIVSQAVSVLSQATSVTQAALSVRIDTQSQGISVLSQQISVLSDQVSVISNKVSALSQSVSVVSVAVNTVSNAVSVVSQALSVQAAALSVRVDTQSQAISILSQQISVLSQGVSVVSNATSNALSVANAASNAASVVSQAVSVVSQALSSQAAALSVRIDTQSQSISVLSQAISVLSQQVSVMSVRTADHGCKVWNSAVISVINATFVTFPFDNEDWDTDAYHDPVTNNSRLTIPTGQGGKYLVTGYANWSSNATGFRYILININGTGTWVASQSVTPVSGDETAQTITTILNLVAGDYIELQGYQNSGITLIIQRHANYTPYFMCQRLA